MLNRFLLLAATLCAALVSQASAENSERIRYLAWEFAPATADSSGSRKYAPDLSVRVLHVALDITPDFKQRSIKGVAKLRVRANVLPASEVTLDAVNLDVSSVTSSETIDHWENDDKSISITFKDPITPGREATITVEYSASPKQGLYFRTPEMGYREGDTHLFTQGESITGRHWYPSIDAPNVMFTSEVTCRVPDGMTVISNGRLVSEGKADGLNVFHWSQEQPHVNYLMTLVAGYFNKLEDKHGDLPLAFFTPPSDFAQATNSFRGTKEMMEFFEEEIGVPYPWAKYYQVCVNDFVAGGMENTSATTLTDNTLFSAASENIHSSEGLVAHELAHQWFGDLVTCKDWSHIWLNEGFATYYEVLWQGKRHGKAEMQYDLFRNAKTILGAGGTPAPIVRRTYTGPDEMFSYLSYDKAGWVLHMLRCQLGEELFRKCVKLYLERHRHSNVVTEDFRRIVEEISGRSYDQFFDQWLYHGGHPELDITYNWEQEPGLARIGVRQVQQLSTNVLLFNVPLPVRFTGDFGTVDKVVQVKKQSEDFVFALPSAPKNVRLDPEYTLLAKIKFTPPAAMLDIQLTNREDIIGRLIAVEMIGKRGDAASMAKVKRVLNEDPHHAVRVAASLTLRNLKTDEALAALLESTDQEDARVRRQVADDIGQFYSDKAYAFGKRRLGEEKNPAIISTLLRDIAAYGKPGLQELLVEHLSKPSYHNEIAGAAIAALRLQDDPATIQHLLETLKRDRLNFTSSGFAQGLTALAHLARNEEDKTEVRDFLVAQLESGRRGIRSAALHALGSLGDTKAIGVVEKFSTSDDRDRSAATSALNALRAARRPIDDLRVLRNEVLDLQQKDRELRKELDELKQKLKELRSAAPASTLSSNPPAPQFSSGDKQRKSSGRIAAPKNAVSP